MGKEHPKRHELTFDACLWMNRLTRINRNRFSTFLTMISKIRTT